MYFSGYITRFLLGLVFAQTLKNSGDDAAEPDRPNGVKTIHANKGDDRDDGDNVDDADDGRRTKSVIYSS